MVVSPMGPPALPAHIDPGPQIPLSLGLQSIYQALIKDRPAGYGYRHVHALYDDTRSLLQEHARQGPGGREIQTVTLRVSMERTSEGKLKHSPVGVRALTLVSGAPIQGSSVRPLMIPSNTFPSTLVRQTLVDLVSLTSIPNFWNGRTIIPISS